MVNWSTFAVPSTTNNVLIPDIAPQTNYPILTTTGNSAKSIETLSNAQITISYGSELTIDGSTSVGLNNGGTISNSGVVHIQNSTGNSLTNTGLFANIGTCSKLNIDNMVMNTSGTLTNEGLLKTHHTTSNQNDNMVVNTGRIYTTMGASPFFTGTGTFNDSGTMLTGSNTLVWSGCAGGSNTDWNNPANWDNYQVPTMSDDVQILNISPSTNYPIIMSTHNQAKSLTISTGASLTIETEADLTLNGSATQGIDNQGSINNSGELKILNAPVSIQNQAHFTNDACGVIEADNQLNNTTAGTFLNKGRLITSHTSTHVNAGSFTNNRIIADANSAFSGVSITSGSLSQITSDATVFYGQESIAGTVSVCITGSVSNFIVNPGTYENYYITNATGDPIGIYDNATATFSPYGNLPFGQQTAYLWSDIPPFAACFRSILSFTLEVNNCKTESINQVERSTTSWEARAYPNPFIGNSTIEFVAPQSTKLEVQVYSIAGNRAATLYQGTVAEGQKYQLSLEAEHLPGGVYIVRFTTAQGTVKHLKLIHASRTN